MKLFNKILFTLISLFVFTASAFSETVADLSTSGRASFVARSGNALTIGTAGTDRLNFIINNTVKAYIDSTGLNASSVVLTNPSISGNATFSTAAAKIIPGATSLTFRNNADSADNLSISDAGVLGIRNDIAFNDSAFFIYASSSDGADGSAMHLTGGGSNSITRGGFVSIYGNEQANIGSVGISTGDAAGSLAFTNLGSATSTWAVRNSSGGNFWSISAADGTFNQSGTNGGHFTMSKVTTGILSGLSSMPSNIQTVTGLAPGLVVLRNSSTTADHAAFISVGAVTNAANLDFFKTRATDGQATTIVNSGDNIGGISFLGADGSAYRFAARILASVDTTPGASDMPGRLNFQVTPDGSSSLADTLILYNNKIAEFYGTVTLPTSGTTIHIQEATPSTACMGAATPNGTTAVTVTTSCAVAGSRVFLSRNGGTVANIGVPTVTSSPNGTNFQIKNTNATETDALSVVWWIVKEA